MTLILLSLLAGIALGAIWQKSRRNFLKKANLITLGGLYFLLIAMGAQLGSNQEIFLTLGSMGIKAFVIALLSITGSVIMLQACSGFILRDPKPLHSASKDGETV